jgi:hypothetical protein
MGKATPACVSCGAAVGDRSGLFCDRCWERKILITIDAAVERAETSILAPDPPPAPENTPRRED